MQDPVFAGWFEISQAARRCCGNHSEITLLTMYTARSSIQCLRTASQTCLKKVNTLPTLSVGGEYSKLSKKRVRGAGSRPTALDAAYALWGREGKLDPLFLTIQVGRLSTKLRTVVFEQIPLVSGLNVGRGSYALLMSSFQ